MADKQLDEEAIFHIARKVPDTDARAEYLGQACGGDPGLRRRVEELLQAHDGPSPFLDSAKQVPPTVDCLVTECPGTVIGRYKLLQKIGEGGFGIVFMAEQQEPVRRRLAIKVVKPGMDSKAVVARFEAERQALALMDHPNIAHIFDGGTTESGRPFFAMELVKGVPLTEYCDRNNSTSEERLQLFLTVCSAVQHAHQKGIIHRDLKPSNIMVTLDDGKPIVKVIDFGVAKALNQPLTEKTLFTAYGQVIGTLQYMSPEQAEMSRLDVDTRSDVYALGVILYELLTGTTPIEAERLRAAGYEEMQRLIREEEPPRPSVRLSTAGEQLTIIAKRRSIDPSSLRQFIRGELDWIVMKCLEKERNRRYDSPHSLATDIERFINHETVLACPPTPGYRLKKFVARRKAILLAAGAIAGSLVIGIVGTTTGWMSAVNKQRETDIARSEAESQLYVSDMCAAERAWERNSLDTVESLLARYRSGSGREHLRGWEWYLLWRKWKNNDTLLSTSFPSGSVLRVGAASKAPLLATASPYGDFYSLWDATSWPVRKIRDIGVEEPDRWGQTFIAVSSDGRWVAHRASPEPSANASPVLWSRPSKVVTIESIEIDARKTLRFGEGVLVTTAQFSPDSRSVGVGASDCLVRVCDVETGEVLTTSPKHAGTVTAISFLPLDRLVVSGDNNGEILVWDGGTGEVRCRLKGHSAMINSLASSLDGKRIISGSNDRTVKIWDWREDRLPKTLDGFRDEVRVVAVSPTAPVLAAGSREGIVRLWNIDTLEELEPIRGFRGSPALDFLSDGRLTFQHPGDLQVVCSVDGRTRATARGSAGMPVLYETDGLLQLAVCPEVKGATATTVRRFNVGEDELSEIDPCTFDFQVGCLAVSSRGTWAVGDGSASHVWVSTKLGDKMATKLTADAGNGVTSAAFSADGRRLAVGFYDGLLATWRLNGRGDGWTRDRTWRAHDAMVTSVAYHPNKSAWLLTGGRDRTAKIWDYQTGMIASPIHRCTNWVFSVAGSPTCGDVAVTHFDRTIDILENGGDTVRCLRGHSTGAVHSAKFLHDGKTLVSVSADQTVKLWDLPTGRERFTVDSSPAIFSEIAVSMDEMVIAAVTRDGSIRVFRRGTDDEVQAAGW